MSPAQAKANAADLREWSKAKPKWTLGEVADYVTECGSHFFTRETMLLFGDTRASFGVVMIGPRLFITRKKAGRIDGKPALVDKIGQLRPVDFERGCVGVELSEDEESELRDRYESEPVPVLFRVDKPGTHCDDVTAVFPTLPGSPGEMTCYARVGQHGSCTAAWMLADTRPAKPEEYAALKRELESAPFYYRLDVRKRISPQMRDARNKAERRT